MGGGTALRAARGEERTRARQAEAFNLNFVDRPHGAQEPPARSQKICLTEDLCNFYFCFYLHLFVCVYF